MKRLYLVLPLFASFILLFTPLARAHWADDAFSSTSMNTTLWDDLIEDDPLDYLVVSQDGNYLNFTTCGGYSQEWTEDNYPFRGYISNWSVSLTDDFEFSVDYHYTHTGDSEASVMLGLGGYDTTDDFWTIGFSAGNGITSTGETGYEVAGEKPETYEDSSFYYSEPYSELNDGTFVVSYDASEQTFTFSAIEEGSEVFSWNDGGESNLDEGGITSLYVGLGCGLSTWSEDAVLADGEAYLDNFRVTCGTVTPEPIGCTLFALGGLCLAALRRRRSMR